MDKNPKKNTPPYLAVGKLQKLLDLVATKSPTIADAVYFEKQGFGSYDSQLAMNALKFLGLLSSEAIPTALWKKWQLPGDGGGKVRAEAIRAAYSDLLNTVPKAYEQSREELKGDLMSVYGLSPRVAESAVPVLIKLFELAGWKQPTTTTSLARAKKPTATTGKERVQSVQISSPSEGLSVIRIIPSKILLYVPEDLQHRAWTDDVLGDELRGIVRSLRLLGEKHLPETLHDDVAVE